MEAIWNWGVSVILWLQQFSPALDLPFKVFTFLGGEEFFLLFLPLLYWCLDKHLGARLTVLFLCASYANDGLKDLFQHPRPPEYDPRVQEITEAGGYGLPSGHTQSTTVLWGYLATQLRKGWMWALAAVLIILVGLSRMYLGVHFPSDVLGGLVAGVLFIALYLWLQPGATRWLAGQGLGWQVGLALVIPLVLLLIHATEDTVTDMAALTGMGTGFAIELRYVSFDSGGVWWKRVLRFILGAVVIFALWYGLKMVFPAGLVFRTVRYGLVGLWGGLGGPWAFVKLGLAETERPRAD